MHNFNNFWSIFCINLISEKIAKLSIDYWVQARGQLYTRKEHRISGKQRRSKSKGDNSVCYYITHIVCLYIFLQASLRCPLLSVSIFPLGVSTMPCIVCIYISLQASLHLYCLSLYSPLGDSTTSYSSSGSKPPGLFSTSLGVSYGPVGLCSVSSCLRHTAPC